MLALVDTRSPSGRRNALLTLFLVATGLRLKEVEQLLIGHVAEAMLARPELALPAKLSRTRQCRLLPLGELARSCIHKLLALYAKNGFSIDSTAPLFQETGGRPMRVESMKKVLRSQAKRAGISGELTSTAFRRVCGHRLHQRGRDLFDIADILGLKTLGAVLKYVPVGEEAAVELLLRSCDPEVWNRESMAKLLHFHFGWWDQKRCQAVARNWHREETKRARSGLERAPRLRVVGKG